MLSGFGLAKANAMNSVVDSHEVDVVPHNSDVIIKTNATATWMNSIMIGNLDAVIDLVYA